MAYCINRVSLSFKMKDPHSAFAFCQCYAIPIINFIWPNIKYYFIEDILRLFVSRRSFIFSALIRSVAFFTSFKKTIAKPTIYTTNIGKNISRIIMDVLESLQKYLCTALRFSRFEKCVVIQRKIEEINWR